MTAWLNPLHGIVTAFQASDGNDYGIFLNLLFALMLAGIVAFAYLIAYMGALAMTLFVLAEFCDGFCDGFRRGLNGSKREQPAEVTVD